MIPSTTTPTSVHTLCTPDQIVRLSAEVAMETAIRMLSENPVYISEKAARKKYKGLLDLWIDNNLVVYIPSEKAAGSSQPTALLSSIAPTQQAPVPQPTKSLKR